MSPAHQGHGGGGLVLAALVLLAAVTLGCLALAGARRREPRGWSR